MSYADYIGDVDGGYAERDRQEGTMSDRSVAEQERDDAAWDARQYVVRLRWTGARAQWTESSLRAAKRESARRWRQTPAYHVEITSPTGLVWEADQTHGRGMLWRRA